MDGKITFSDVLTTEDIDFLIGTCMRPSPIEESHMATKIEKDYHVDYSITELAVNLNQVNESAQSNGLIPYSEGKMDYESNCDLQRNLYRNSLLHLPTDIYQNCKPSTRPQFEYESIKQELPSQSKQPMRKKPKRFRTAFTARQMLTLEREYQSSQYLGKVRRAELAISFGLSEQTIKTWFQNRRMKSKREGKESPKHSQSGDSSCPSNKPYGDSQWSIYPNNCAMEIQQGYQRYQHGIADLKQTVHRW